MHGSDPRFAILYKVFLLMLSFFESHSTLNAPCCDSISSGKFTGNLQCLTSPEQPQASELHESPRLGDYLLSTETDLAADRRLVMNPELPKTVQLQTKPIFRQMRQQRVLQAFEERVHHVLCFFSRGKPKFRLNVADKFFTTLSGRFSHEPPQNPM
jgi:hypothetical protein